MERGDALLFRHEMPYSRPVILPSKKKNKNKNSNKNSNNNNNNNNNNKNYSNNINDDSINRTILTITSNKAEGLC